jgi:hypothetical protein
MKFGVREIANVVFRAKAETKIGSATFKAGQPVLYIDSAKTSTLEGAATTVYAQGGRGNTRLIAWEGEKTLTFTVEDALLSPMGLSVLSGAGLLEGTKYGVDTDPAEVYVHTTSNAFMTSAGVVDLSDILGANENIADTDVFVVLADIDGSLKSKAYSSVAKEVSVSGKTLTVTGVTEQSNVFVDFYIKKSKEIVSELQIDAENFAGYYYVEADTLFRRQADGVDLPANITLPNVKIQSNFAFTMASTGDPSTFTFTMDAFPGYTYFDNKKKVLCVMQVIEDVVASNDDLVSVMD